MGTKSTDYKNNYNKDNYSRIALYFPKDFKDNISDLCNASDVPMAEFIKNLVYEKIGDYFNDCISEINAKIEIYYLVPEWVMLFTCGKRWLFCAANNNGHILGAKVYGDCHEQLTDYFAKKKPTATSFNIWEKVISSSSEQYSVSGDDYDGDFLKLFEKLDFDPEQVKIYKIYDSADQDS